MEKATKEKIKKRLPAFILGIVLGVLAGHFVPELWTDPFVGTVTGKKRLRDRLMVMIHMEHHGDVIATFTDKIGQIDFLLRPGDTVELGLAIHEVLVDNPTLKMVERPDGDEIVGDETLEGIRSEAESPGPGDASGAPASSGPASGAPGAPASSGPADAATEPQPASGDG